MTATPASRRTGRVLGWDVLRGLCALAVASYHLLDWQGLATFPALGSYGVYMFFVLSGASLAYNYGGRISSAGEAVAFLATRWLRLAPLYLVLCGVFIVMLAARDGQWVDALPARLALNATFAFGVHDPTVWALLIGGWSLGIEFCYYLAFPLLLAALPHHRWRVLLALAFGVIQWAWVVRTAGSAGGYASNVTAYHQLPAFIAYFFGGCVIGYWRRITAASVPLPFGAAAWLLMAVLLLALGTPRQGDELLGLRGATLFAACFAIVHVSGLVKVGSRLAVVARWLGDITYGCYLLHPFFLFGFAWFVLPRFTALDITALPVATRLAVYAVVLALSCAAATASERWFEGPLRRWGKRLLPARRRRPGADYSEAASISS